jgi:hypothetical protein
MNALLKKTGTMTTAHRAGDGRYLSELLARADRQFEAITVPDVDAMIGHAWRIFQATAEGKMVQRSPEVVGQRQGRAGAIPIHSGIISPGYAAVLTADIDSGACLFVRKIVGIKALALETPFYHKFPRGDVRPLTYTAKLTALEFRWTDELSQAEKLSICGKVVRAALRHQPLRRQTVKTAAGIRKTAQTVAAHNLVLCPSPIVLAELRTKSLPVDLVMEVAARRALERYERKKGVKLTAICSTHLEDSTGFRPHLHIRLVAYDSNGKYVPIFDRACGQTGGNRCIFEEEMQRQFDREIERER